MQLFKLSLFNSVKKLNLLKDTKQKYISHFLISNYRLEWSAFEVNNIILSVIPVYQTKHILELQYMSVSTYLFSNVWFISQVSRMAYLLASNYSSTDINFPVQTPTCHSIFSLVYFCFLLVQPSSPSIRLYLYH